MRLIIVLIFIHFFFVLNIEAQTIEGVVKDSLTSEPIPFIHIYSEEFELGTISNEEGEFSFSFLNNLKSDSIKLVFSHVSYGKYEQFIHLNKFNDISILYNKIFLDEVVVKNEGYKIAVEIARWLKNGSLRYGKGFYRQVSYQDTLATKFVEAFYEISVNRNEIEGIKQNQARFARKKTTKESPFMIFQNFPFATTMIKMISGKNSSIVSPFSEKGIESYSFEIIDSYRNNGENFVIVKCIPPETDQNSDNLIWMNAEVVYSSTREQMIQYEAIINNGLGAENISGVGFDVEVKVENPKYHWKVTFDNNTGVINQIRTNYTYNYWIGDKKYPSNVVSKFLVFEFSDKRIRKLSSPNLDVLTISNIENAKYRSRFWNENPIIKRTEKEEQIILTFEEENAFGNYFK